jgi:hypothetical protein
MMRTMLLVAGVALVGLTSLGCRRSVETWERAAFPPSAHRADPAEVQSPDPVEPRAADARSNG